VAQVVEVEIDEETGEVDVRRITTSHNTGNILNPLTHQGQIDGAVMMGVGYGIMEQIMTDDGGKVLNANLGDYKIPNIKDIPQLKTAIFQSDTGSGPYNILSIGETAIFPTAAAIANAVEELSGRASCHPQPRKKWAAIKQRGCIPAPSMTRRNALRRTVWRLSP
jgi:CO/xanthine dehydrogenase Mo-binding subunit